MPEHRLSEGGTIGLNAETIQLSVNRIAARKRTAQKRKGLPARAARDSVAGATTVAKGLGRATEA